MNIYTPPPLPINALATALNVGHIGGETFYQFRREHHAASVSEQHCLVCSARLVASQELVQVLHVDQGLSTANMLIHIALLTLFLFVK